MACSFPKPSNTGVLLWVFVNGFKVAVTFAHVIRFSILWRLWIPFQLFAYSVYQSVWLISTWWTFAVDISTYLWPEHVCGSQHNGNLAHPPQNQPLIGVWTGKIMERKSGNWQLSYGNLSPLLWYHSSPCRDKHWPDSGGPCVHVLTIFWPL